MLVYIADDSKTDIIRIGTFLKKYAESLGVEEITRVAFESGEALLSYYKEKKEEPYLVLLDIYMDGMNGIETARKLRDMGCKARLIFATSSENHMMDAFSVYADGYLRKPYNYEEFVTTIDRLRSRFENEGHSISILVDRTPTKIRVNDILFVEASGHSVIFHLKDNEIRVNSKISDIQALFDEKQHIIPVGRSYLVNLVHVSTVEDGMILMDNDADVPIPVRLKKQIEEKINEYKYQ